MSSKTKQLARKLGLIPSKRKRLNEDADDHSCLKRRRKGQHLSYVIVIDFESTCWEKKKGSEEIIEFPAVLLELHSGELVSEFQQYVLPLENPKLSDFCTHLTGITQDQVDNGIPLPTCLRLFGQWVSTISTQKDLVVMEPGHEYNEDLNLCALATWSDWDLGVCLNYECRRKQIRKPFYMNQWMDIRALYKEFYDRRPSGLNGALEDLGIKFCGREHCGLDDARNTANLCYRMAKDGCKLAITKCISKIQATVVKLPGACVQDTTSTEQSSTSSKCESLQSTGSSPHTQTGEMTVEQSKNTPGCNEKANCSLWETKDFSEEFVKEFEIWEDKHICCSEDTSSVNHIPETTSSRNQYVTHVAPVTVLHQGEHAVMEPSLKDYHKQTKTKQQPYRFVATDAKITETSSFQPQHPVKISTPSSGKAQESSGSFRTPSTTEWMKVKNTPTNSSTTYSTVLMGGKVTPPLCDCGKRARRKTATKPGPNDGKHFYVCPSGKGSSRTHGCGFFRWVEQSNFSNCTCAELSSDYSN